MASGWSPYGTAEIRGLREGRSEMVRPGREKPVDVQALWLNVLKIDNVLSDQWNELW